jgi:deoxyguanosine kinase
VTRAATTPVANDALPAGGAAQTHAVPPRPALVAIEGPTGVGKTTLAARLAAALRATLVLDPFADNPFLPALLARGSEATRAEALRVELTFLALRVAQLRDVAKDLAAGRTVVADWALMKQAIFAATTLDPADAERVAETVQVWAPSLPVPTTLIGLSAPTAVLLARVCQRGRAMEAGVTERQLASLTAAFEAAYARWPGPFIGIDVDVFDAFDDRQVAELAARVRRLAAAATQGEAGTA